MGRIARLEVANFKSYGGAHVVGPFRRFTAVVGPNGAGKSNLMDAISFVLGVGSRQLRSTQLRDLVHKPPVAPESPLRASVTLVFELDESDGQPRQELRFTRAISEKGIGAYRLDDRDVSFDAYQQRLKDIGVLVKARNFLVFQGDVESVAAKSPEELAKLFEQISGSDELRCVTFVSRGRLVGIKEKKAVTLTHYAANWWERQRGVRTTAGGEERGGGKRHLRVPEEEGTSRREADGAQRRQEEEGGGEGAELLS